MELNPEYSNKFDLVYMDPPWSYGSRGARGGKFGELDYKTMSLKELQQMPVAEILADDAAILMWTTSPL